MIHNILFIKGLYPKEAFVSRNLFGVSIKAVGENSLKAYISNFISSIKELVYKGILGALVLQILHNEKITESLVIKLNWIFNIYSYTDTDKLVSHSQLDTIYGNILSDIYSMQETDNSTSTFQIIVETIKEEASENEEALERNNWQLVCKEISDCKNSGLVDSIIKVGWDLV